jgi:hypothetical protein
VFGLIEVFGRSLFFWCDVSDVFLYSRGDIMAELTNMHFVSSPFHWKHHAAHSYYIYLSTSSIHCEDLNCNVHRNETASMYNAAKPIKLI